MDVNLRFAKDTDSNHLQPINTLYIDDLCVDQRYRGHHVGRRIYGHVKAYAKTNGFHNLTLNVWSCNPGAISFY